MEAGDAEGTAKKKNEEENENENDFEGGSFWNREQARSPLESDDIEIVLPCTWPVGGACINR